MAEGIYRIQEASALPCSVYRQQSEGATLTVCEKGQSVCSVKGIKDSPCLLFTRTRRADQSSGAQSSDDRRQEVAQGLGRAHERIWGIAYSPREQLLSQIASATLVKLGVLWHSHELRMQKVL